MLHVSVKVLMAETRFLLYFACYVGGASISVLAGGPSSCLVAAQLFSAEVVDHARMQMIRG